MKSPLPSRPREEREVAVACACGIIPFDSKDVEEIASRLREKEFDTQAVAARSIHDFLLCGGLFSGVDRFQSGRHSHAVVPAISASGQPDDGQHLFRTEWKSAADRRRVPVFAA